MTTGATAVTRPPATGRRRKTPSGVRARVNGRRFETTIKEEEVSDMVLRLSETTESINKRFTKHISIIYLNAKVAVQQSIKAISEWIHSLKFIF